MSLWLRVLREPGLLLYGVRGFLMIVIVEYIIVILEYTPPPPAQPYSKYEGPYMIVPL